MENQNLIVSYEGPMAWANKTGIYSMIFISINVENWLLYDAIHDFSVWFRTLDPVLIKRILIGFEAIL